MGIPIDVGQVALTEECPICQGLCVPPHLVLCMNAEGQTEVWITAARCGDSIALAKLLAAYHPVLRARAEARMDPAVRARTGPEDVLQEVYTQVFRHMGRFEDRGTESFLGWINTILDRKLIDARRAAHRNVRNVDREVPRLGPPEAQSYWNLLDHAYADTRTPSRVVRRQEAMNAVVASLSSLPDAHRQVLQLRFLDGLSVAEAAARLSKTEAAVVALTQRALKALRESMDRLGEFTRGL